MNTRTHELTSRPEAPDSRSSGPEVRRYRRLYTGIAGIVAAAALWCAGIQSSSAQGGFDAAQVVDQHNADKLVPILSGGTGLRVGAALVTGPSSRVGETVAVAQLEGKWKNIVEGRVLVPVSNPKVTGGISRVPEVSVYAVGNYRI